MSCMRAGKTSGSEYLDLSWQELTFVLLNCVSWLLEIKEDGLMNIFAVSRGILHNLGKFPFAASQLFSSCRRQPSDIENFLRLVESLEELQSKVQGMIWPLTYPRNFFTMCCNGGSSTLTGTWQRCLPRCWRSQVPASPCKPILFEFERGRYIGLFLPISLDYFVTGKR